MTETHWTPAELAHIGDTEEIRISTGRDDGTLRAFVPIWIVAADGNLYVRSYRGLDGAWYRHARHHPAGRLRTDGTDRSAMTVAKKGLRRLKTSTTPTPPSDP
ncbi:DUF2255 family protein [Nocardia sp. CA-120079]|uniref:DUF2255 family protein n=1 Tax=Nocardia sp. CA-120079 TaxID=3239974 RepID=UPI003D97EB95